MTGPHEGIAALASQWAEKAEHDYTAAVRLLRHDERDTPYDIVCFHAQQCVEKYLKAVCVSVQAVVPRSHDISELLPLLPEQVGNSLAIEELAELNPYAVEVRYPDFSENLTRDDAVRAMKIVDKVRLLCSRYIRPND